MIKNNNVKIMGVFASVLLLVIIVTSSFAYFGSFNVNLNNNVAVNVNSVSPGDSIFTSNATQLNLQVPAANMSQLLNGTLAAENTATLTINLTGAADLLTTCTYDIVYEYDDGSYIYGGTGTNHVGKNGDKEITLQITNVNGTNNFVSEKNFDYDSNWSNNKRILVSGATISSTGKLTTKNINITGKFYNLNVSQESIGGKTFTGKIYVTNNKCSTGDIPPAYVTILNNNGGQATIDAKGIPDFSKVSTTNDGMYAAEDDYTATTGMKSYYFRGAVNNNWVKFGKYTSDGPIRGYDSNGNYIEYSSIEKCGDSVNDNCSYAWKSGDDMYWRIIRINGDGSVRMIYSGTIKPDSSTATVMTGNSTQVSVRAYDTSKNNPLYVGYKYTLGQQHGSSTNALIKSAIDNWYNMTTMETDGSTKDLISDQIFCNDRSAITSEDGTPGEISGGLNTSTTYYYGAYIRLITNKSPKLTCTTASDKFTVNTSNGNGALTYPVGLITADEVAMAGGVTDMDNNSYYLHTNQDYWLGTPSFYANIGYAIGFYVDSSGSLNSNPIANAYRVRPVISLAAKAQFSGDGTYTNPYTVS